MPDDHIALLRSHFGFDAFRPGQQEAIQSLFENQHTLVVMPTGAGKSLIFQLASLEFPGVTLVISPLIALMKDQVDSLTRRQIPATYINSILPAAEQIERLKKLAKGHYRLVYVAPERLRNSSFQDAIHHQPISLLAVDEAHCISEWGHDFRPDYLHIAQARAGFGNPLTIALTATATPRVQNDILRLLGLKDLSTRIVTGFNRANLSLNVTYTNGLPAKLRALKELLSVRTSGSVIIYAGTRRDAEEIAEFVREVVKVPAEYYHAGTQNDERSRIQNEFMGGKLNVIVATNAFGMGIDRADVRQVIHYSMPGSLEAYYQEAGRAGRDELPARVTLLYDPQDRALQEFFIQQSELTAGDLHTIFNTIRKGESSTTVDDLSRMTGLHPVQLLIGLSALESTGGLEHLYDDGIRKMYRKGIWAELEIEKAIRKSKEHLQLRQNQLSTMVDYAELNECRRKIILKHFGDTGKAEAADCCDNCRASNQVADVKREITEMSHMERTALIILDCIRRLKIKVGQGKLAQILHGSRAKDIIKFQHDRNIYYGRMAAVKQSDIEAVIGQLMEKGYIKSIGGEYPILSLTPRGENAIHQKESITLKMPKSFGTTEIRRAKEKMEAGSSLEYTARLFAEDLKPEQIAHERGLSTNTIYTHLAELITAGRIAVVQVVPAEKIFKIEAAIQQVGSTDYLTPIKDLLPDEIDYNLIRCVVAEHRKQKTDPITSFLEASHPRPLTGLWQQGWSLGFHSRFSGGDWARSGVGDLTFRLKYEGDVSVLPALVIQSLDLFRMHPEMTQVDFIFPVPPSIQRPTDPVQAFCGILAEKTGIPMQTCVIKIRQTQAQKELKTLTQKRANVSGAFALRSDVSGKRILLVDDLFDSGATLDEITRLLKQRGAECINVLTLTRTIHSDT